jgi:hypothetical protein
MSQVIYTEGNVRELMENMAWKEIVSRIETMLRQEDANIENPDSFLHGRAVGARAKLREILGMPEELIRVKKQGANPSIR